MGDESHDTPLERGPSGLTGWLYNAESWLRDRLKALRPSLARVGQLLASYRVTGVTVPRPIMIAPLIIAIFRLLMRVANFGQRSLMGDRSLEAVTPSDSIKWGPLKIHISMKADVAASGPAVIMRAMRTAVQWPSTA